MGGGRGGGGGYIPEEILLHPDNPRLEGLKLFVKKIFWRIFIFFLTGFNTASSAAPVSTDAGIIPKTVATGALAVGRSNH
jgi:hypothetical protein